MTIAAGTEATPRFFYVKEVATELRRTEAGVRWLLHTGKLRAGSLGGRTVISAKELERFIAAGLGETGEGR